MNKGTAASLKGASASPTLVVPRATEHVRPRVLFSAQCSTRPSFPPVPCPPNQPSPMNRQMSKLHALGRHAGVAPGHGSCLQAPEEAFLFSTIEGGAELAAAANVRG